MGKNIDRQIKEYIKEIILVEDMLQSDVSEISVLANKYYKDNKETFDKEKVNLRARKIMMLNFIRFAIQYKINIKKEYKEYVLSLINNIQIMI